MVHYPVGTLTVPGATRDMDLWPSLRARDAVTVVEAPIIGAWLSLVALGLLFEGISPRQGNPKTTIRLGPFFGGCVHDVSCCKES